MSTKNAVLAHHFADFEQQHEASTLGMWVFLATELMVFGALFTGYAVYRSRYPAEFAAASGELNLVFGGINTVVLLTSSLTMALAVYGAQTSQRKILVTCLVLTALLGAAFLIVKGFEYYVDYVENLIPGVAFADEAWLRRGLNPGNVKLFLLLYYIMTGIHALHLLVGIVWIVLLAALARSGHFLGGYFAPVEVGGLYWHFVDIVWIFLLPLLYLVGVR